MSEPTQRATESKVNETGLEQIDRVFVNYYRFGYALTLLQYMSNELLEIYSVLTSTMKRVTEIEREEVQQVDVIRAEECLDQMRVYLGVLAGNVHKYAALKE